MSYNIGWVNSPIEWIPPYTAKIVAEVDVVGHKCRSSLGKV